MSSSQDESSVSDNSERVLGRVKWFNHTRGYGFVTSLNSNSAGNDVFVHHTCLSTSENVYRSLSQGEYIEFTLQKDSENKDCAKDVTGVLKNPLLCEVPKPNRLNRRDEQRGSDRNDA